MASKPTIKQKISKYNYSSRHGYSIKYIVIHYVGAVSSAANNATYFSGGNRNASAHYFVDENSIWQSVLDSNAAWHCGGGYQDYGTKYGGGSLHGSCINSNSIGIEMCVYRSSGKYYVKDGTVSNAAKLVKYLMDKYGVPERRVIRHWDVTGKSCPYVYRDNGKTLLDAATWKSFRNTLTGTTSGTSTTNTSAAVKGGYTGDFPTARVGIGYGTAANTKLWQKFLCWYGPDVDIDGIFGKDTKAKTVAFQKAKGLEQDGIAGPLTLAAAKKTTK